MCWNGALYAVSGVSNLSLNIITPESNSCESYVHKAPLEFYPIDYSKRVLLDALDCGIVDRKVIRGHQLLTTIECVISAYLLTLQRNNFQNIYGIGSLSALDCRAITACLCGGFDVYADRVRSHVLAFVDFALPCRDLHFASFCPFLRQTR